MTRTQNRQERWRERNLLKLWAQAVGRSAVLRGLIKKPGHCVGCGGPGPVEAHHSNHGDPLRVIWLCRTCHKRTRRDEQHGGSQ